MYQAGLEKKLAPDRTVDARESGGTPATWRAPNLALELPQSALPAPIGTLAQLRGPHLQPALGNSSFTVVRFPLFLASIMKKKNLWAGIL